MVETAMINKNQKEVKAAQTKEVDKLCGEGVEKIVA